MARSDFGFQIGSALATGYLTDSKFIRGSYIVVADIAARNALPVDTGDGGVVIEGTLVYVQSDDNFYQYDGTTWVQAKIGGDSVFWCTYGTTTYADIHAALVAGKIVKCISEDLVYTLTKDIGSFAYFGCAFGTTNNYLQVSSSNVWAKQPVTVEATWNKVTAISASSTNSQYPSAKCVYDNFQLYTPTTDLPKVIR